MMKVYFILPLAVYRKKEAVGMLILAFLDEAVQEIDNKEMADEIREILRLDLEGGLE
jgi:hypothetical protein